MKHKILALYILAQCCIAVSICSAQQEVFRIDSIPSTGILLDRLWHFKMDADPTGTWYPINPNWDIRDSLPEQARNGIGTMRLYCKPAAGLDVDHFSLIIQQSIASSYYLNGKPLVSYGTVHSDPKKVIAKDAYWFPTSIALVKDSINMLEIRFATPNTRLFTTVFETQNPIANIQLFDSNDGNRFYSQQVRNYHVFVGIIIALCFMITIIHFAFYFFNPATKANFWFGISRVIFVIASLLQMIYWFYTKDVSHKYWYGTLAMNLLTLTNLISLYAVSLHFNHKLDLWHKVTIGLFFITAFFIFYPAPWAWRLGPVFQLIIQLSIIRIAYKNKEKNKFDSMLIMIGAVATVLFFIKFISMGTFSSTAFFTSLYPARMVIYFAFLMCLPVIFSMLLAKEFSNTSKSLKTKLVEVQSLSENNLRIEQEKQQLLENQNQVLEKEVTERTSALNQTLLNLQSTQSQLIQSEKMASLGELTAGIAHEIQNPLNFVNNFSELNSELIKELEEEARSEKRDTKNEAELLLSIKENSEKINHHGKRAESIVKGMLEHSRKSSGIKELTDINKLCDEYVRLSYHARLNDGVGQGLRAKDPKFNCDYKLDIDPNLPMVNVVSQDIGRVILNIINNAFQACAERHRSACAERLALSQTEVSRSASAEQSRSTGSLNLENQEDYKPLVVLTTKFSASQRLCEICISDNGPGIPPHIKDKIFQPFFTTKPTGQGTGLGLSLAYDIVKAHGGTIEVISADGNGTEFIILLPL